MNGKRLKTTITAVLVLMSLRAWSTESNSDLSSELNTKMNTMNEQKATMALESEVVSLDNEDYQASEKQTLVELNKLNSDIKDLERQQRTLAQGANRARIKAELADKRLQLKKTQQADAQNRLKKADNEKKQADHRHSQVTAKVELAVQQLSQTKQKTREVLDSIRAIEKDNAKLKSRIDQMKKMIAQEKKRNDGLRSKRVRLTEEGQRLRAQNHKLEKST
jgi:chromosome segregation ATPase